ncbi:MAG TPA: winged helix-turn-helix domain-containing protein [Ghiorsea sp.]|nr:winged helix-turn-helix domain-containing protein [Ghiorsea sp.]HIP06506.1 winged helix-turn-helix domain-containing protein [Mariprofundaceae bacterium]
MTSQWRQLALSRQGLTSKQPFGSGVDGTLQAIKHLGYVQVDTLSVVERAHHHVLWNRVPDYHPDQLNQLVSDKKIFEYWYHAASYLPMRDYRFSLPNMLSIRNGENRYYTKVDKGLMKEILTRIQGEGPLRLRDLKTDNKKHGKWWGMAPCRRALEVLFMQGDVMVCKRNGMEKVFDLSEHCLPDDINLNMPTPSEYAAYLFDTTLRAHGIFTWKQLVHLKTGKTMRGAMSEVLHKNLETGIITAINHPDMPNTYITTQILEQPPTQEKSLKILSPFDNVVIHRDRLSALFGFDYTIECYVPAAKRVFGYFCLPILYGDTFAGRIDCKVHRSEQRFEVISLHIEDKTLDRDQFIPALMAALQKFADFNKCPQLDAI